MEDDGYIVVFWKGHVFLDRKAEEEAVLLGKRKECLYIVHGHTIMGKSDWLSDSEEEQQS